MAKKQVKQVKQVTYEVTTNLGSIQEMAQYEGGTFEILETIKDDSDWHDGFAGFNIVRARVTSPYRNDARWRSFGVRFCGESQKHEPGLTR